MAALPALTSGPIAASEQNYMNYSTEARVGEAETNGEEMQYARSMPSGGLQLAK
jgi:hypothetical protein